MSKVMDASGIRETQEMLDFCAEHGIVWDIEIIPIQQINQAYDRLLKGDVRYRFPRSTTPRSSRRPRQPRATPLVWEAGRPHLPSHANREHSCHPA